VDDDARDAWRRIQSQWAADDLQRRVEIAKEVGARWSQDNPPPLPPARNAMRGSNGDFLVLAIIAAGIGVLCIMIPMAFG
jgi:hypothetical protein